MASDASTKGKMNQPRKIVAITGANSGIGFATAKALAGKGYHILTVCRNKDQGEQTIRELTKINPDFPHENFSADLSDLDAVRKVAKAIIEKYPVIDRLINNAGYYPSKIEYVGEIEKSFLASHLGHMLLTQLLMPALVHSPESRIINVSSALHAGGSITRFFKRSVNHEVSQAYGDAKLANVLFTKGLAETLPGRVTTYAVHPGVVRTNFASDSSGFFGFVIKVFRPFFISMEKGALAGVYLVDTDIEKIRSYSGGYFHQQNPRTSPNKDVTEQNASWLWDKSLEILSPYLAA
jgi:retinol dehydrogenase-12